MWYSKSDVLLKLCRLIMFRSKTEILPYREIFRLFKVFRHIPVNFFPWFVNYVNITSDNFMLSDVYLWIWLGEMENLISPLLNTLFRFHWRVNFSIWIFMIVDLKNFYLNVFNISSHGLSSCNIWFYFIANISSGFRW